MGGGGGGGCKMGDGLRPTALCSFVCDKNILPKETWPVAFY